MKQAPRAGYIKIDRYLDEQGFQRSPSDSTTYVKRVGNDIILLVIYVDDIVVTGSEEKAIEHIKNNISKDFDMTDLGLLHYCLGVEFWKTGSSVFISQSKYVRGSLDRFKMTDCKISSTPMEKGLKLSAQADSKAVNESIYKQMLRDISYSD